MIQEVRYVARDCLRERTVLWEEAVGCCWGAIEELASC